MNATPDNTAVVTILAYETEDQIPTTAKFMFASAARFGIDVHPFLFGEKYPYTERPIDQSYQNKIVRLRPHIEALPYNIEYVLYVDSRDVLFVRSLKTICDYFNIINWPILMSSTKRCRHHFDPGWQARFPKHPSGYDYNNAGVWMAERDSLMRAFDSIAKLSVLVADDKIASSYPPLHNNDQHLWQTAYVEHIFPLRLDFDQMIFNSFHQTDFEQYDFSQSTDNAPIVLKSGANPSILHFAGDAAATMPYLAWLLKIVPAAFTPELPTLSKPPSTDA